MDSSTFDNLALSGRKELIKLRQIVSEFEKETNLITLKKVDNSLHRFIDISGKYSYDIKLASFDKRSRRNIYLASFNPSSEHSLVGTSYNFTLDQIAENIRMWIGLVSELHQVEREYYEPFGKFYDDEFKTYFSNNEEDADVNPFDLKRQELIFLFLNYAESTISTDRDMSDANRQTLIDEISVLKEEIPNVTKKKFVLMLSKFAQKVKKFSNKVFHEVFDVLKKEAIKKVLTEGWNSMPGNLDDIKGWLQHLS